MSTLREAAQALRLADWFEGGYGGCELEAAAELRRLHDIEKAYESACGIINEQDKKLAEMDLAVAAQREKLAHWMRSLGYATGHGDTIEDLLDHLGTQISEGLEAEVTMEREACAKAADLVAREIDDTNGTATYIAAVIRARSKE